MPHVAIRPATEGDVDRVTAIERAAFADPWSRPSFVHLLGDRRAFFAVARAPDGAVAGYVVAWFVADEGEIGNLAVDAAQRRRGIASALLAATVAAAREREVAALYLEVRDSNAAARALYAGAGFEAVGRRRDYYRHPREDAIVLRLALTPS